jgi:hypothetical protein
VNLSPTHVWVIYEVISSTSVENILHMIVWLNTALEWAKVNPSATHVWVNLSAHFKMDAGPYTTLQYVEETVAPVRDTWVDQLTVHAQAIGLVTKTGVIECMEFLEGNVNIWMKELQSYD